MRIYAACDCRTGFHRGGCSARAAWRVEYDILWGLVRRVKFLCHGCLPFVPFDPPQGVTIQAVEP